MRHGSKISAALIGCFLILAPAAAGLAQQAPRPSPAPSAALDLPTVLDLQINKARAIDLPRSVSRVVIGNEAIADIQLDRTMLDKAFIMARAVGSTNVFFMNAKGRILHQMEVRVTFDHQVIERALRQLIKGGTIKVRVMRDTVFLTGKVRSAADSAKALSIARRFAPGDDNIINMLTVQGAQQVLLKVRVAEISRTIRKSLAVDQTVSQTLSGDKSIVFSTAGVFPPTETAYATGTIITQLTGLGPTTFRVLEKQGLVKTLAEPTLTALSGETATFLSGGETPVPIGRDTETGNVLFEFHEFGIRLSFTPVVIDNGRINLRVATEVSDIDANLGITIDTFTIPGFTQKRTETTIDLPSGGTIMIAGLLKDNVTDNISGFPFLKDIPILGALFRSSEFQRDETELIITVTAYLVKPVDSETALSLPTDGFEPAGDMDFYLLGRLHREYANTERPIWAPALKGPFGYIME